MGIVNRNGALWMATGVDNSGLYSGLNQAEGRIDQFGAHVGNVGNQIAKLTGIGFGVAGLKAFGSEIINVRGEMQMLESSFEVLLGGKGVSGFMSEMKQFAVDSPLSLTSVGDAAQMLLAFGVEADKVMPVVKQLGDVSMGNTGKFQSLALAFSQMTSAGKVLTNDLRQMATAGFNPLGEIARTTGRSIQQVTEQMDKGQITVDMIANAFATATSEGGKFYGMTQKQAEGIKGLQAQLEGGLQDAFNEIGESQEGLIAGGYKVAISLVENYETIGKALTALIATYGAYRTAVALNISIEKGWTISQLAHYKALLLVEKAQKILRATMLSNPYVAATVVVVGLVTTIWALHDATTAQEQAQKRLNEINEQAAERKQNLENETQRLIGIVNSETKTIYDQISAYKELQGMFSSLLRDMDIQTFKAMSATQQQKLLNEAINELDTDSSVKELENQQKKVDELRKKAELYSKSSYSASVGDSSGASYKRQLEREENVLELLKEQKDKREQTRREAEFLALPEEEQQKRLEKQLLLLEKQKDIIEKQIEKAGGLRDEWDQFNPILSGMNTHLGNILKQIEETQNKLTKSPSAIKNKSFWEQQKKDAESALGAMTETDKGSKEWNKQLKLLNEAQSKLKLWNFSTEQGESAAEKARKQAQDIIDQNERLLLLEKRQGVERQRAEEDLQNKATQASIDAMQDGAEKKAKQRDLDNKLELQAIDRQKEDYVQAIIQAQRELFDIQEELAVKKGEKKEKGVFKADPTSVDTSFFDNIKQNIKNKHSNYPLLLEEQEENAWTEYYIRFGNYLEKRKAIIDKYSKEIDKSQSQAQKATLIKEMQDSLDELDNSVKGSSTLMAKLFSDSSNKSIKEIQKIIDKTKLLLKYLEATKDKDGNAIINGKSVSKSDILDLGISPNSLENLQNSTQEVEALRNGLKNLEGDLGNKSPFKLLESQVNEAITTIASGNIAGGLLSIADTIDKQLLPMMDELGEGLGGIFGDGTGDFMKGLTEAVNDLKDLTKGVGQILSGDVVGGSVTLISTVGRIVGRAREVNNEHKEALRLLEMQTKQIEHQYELSKLRAKVEYAQGKTVFGSDVWGQSRSSAEAYARAQEKALKSYKELQKVDLVTGSRKSGWGPWKKRKDVWTDLLEAVPELIDEYGKLDVVLAENILANRKLSDEGKQTLQEAIDNAKLLEDAYATMKDNLTSIFGSLGQTITDVFADAFASGTDDISKMVDNAGDMLESLTKQMIYSMTLQPLFDQATEEMMKIQSNLDLSDEAKLRSLTSIVGNLIAEAGKEQERVNELLGYAKEEASKQGIDLFDDGKREGAKGGFTNASQESVNEYLGVLYGVRQIQGDIRNINIDLRENSTKLNEMVLDMRAVVNDNNQILQDSLDYQSQIATNTYRTAEILDAIETYGLKLKQ